MLDPNKARLYVTDPLPKTPWPVAAKRLLTNREQKLYDALHKLYPDHRLFVQVALSQLIDVPKDHPERYSIRARFCQLVADFVLCLPDLSVAAVIELDDRSHENPIRQAADARKTKALLDAGLRLIRIPAGPLPSAADLREILEGRDTQSAIDERGEEMHQLARSETELRLADDWDTSEAEAPRIDHDLVASQAIRRIVMKAVLGFVVCAFGWFVYLQFVPSVVQHSHGGLAKPLDVSHSVDTIPPLILPAQPLALSALSGPTRQEPETTRDAELRADEESRQKYLAWTAYYQSPASCEHPVNWNTQVECGNQYMRAKGAFEAQWARDHGFDNPSAALAVLDNHSLESIRLHETSRASRRSTNPMTRP